MNKQRAIGGLATLAVLAIVVTAVAIGTGFGVQAPKPNRVAYPTYVQSVPEGCRPVAPGAYSTICEARTASVPQPSHGNKVLVCRPVAPGAFSEVCTYQGVSTPAVPAPDTASTVICRPVAPGAFTEICTRR